MATCRGNEAALRAVEILGSWNESPQYPSRGRCRVEDWTTLEEERREVLDAVLESVASGEPDCERTAACLELLRHVACLGLHETRVRVS